MPSEPQNLLVSRHTISLPNGCKYFYKEAFYGIDQVFAYYTFTVIYTHIVARPKV